jgi:hypothetical protein
MAQGVVSVSRSDNVGRAKKTLPTAQCEDKCDARRTLFAREESE